MIKFKLFLCIFFGSIGLPFLGLGLSEIKNTIIQQKNSIHCSRVVVDNVLQSGAGGSVYQAQVAFKTQHGVAIRFTDVRATYPALYHIGDTVQVFYNSNLPQGAQVFSFAHLYLIPIIFCVLGLIPLVLVAIVLLQLKKMAN